MSDLSCWLEKFSEVKEDSEQYDIILKEISSVKLSYSLDDLRRVMDKLIFTKVKLIAMVSDLCFRTYLTERMIYSGVSKISSPTPIFVELFTHYPELLSTLSMKTIEHWKVKDVKPFLKHLTDEQLEDYLTIRTYAFTSKICCEETREYVQHMYPLIKSEETKISVLVHIKHYCQHHTWIDRSVLTVRDLCLRDMGYSMLDEKGIIDRVLSKVQLYYCDVMGRTCFDEKAIVDIVASYI
jgi:hypothetical protein